MHYALTVAILVCLSSGAMAQKNILISPTADRFATLGEKQERSRQKEIDLKAGGSLHPYPEWHLPERDWPDLSGPTKFNQYFDKPAKVWKVDGGYFSSFDAGEFGGALFFAGVGTRRWILTINGHVQSLARFTDGTFLAVGGIAHLGCSTGAVYLLTQKRDGNWKAKKVFESDLGVPELWGTSCAIRLIPPEYYATIRLNLQPGEDYGVGPVFAITAKGVPHYIGEEKRDNSEQCGGGRR